MTRIKWKKDTKLKVMENEHDSYDEEVRAGELDDVDIIADNGDSVDIQYACGDVSYSVSKDFFEVVPEQK